MPKPARVQGAREWGWDVWHVESQMTPHRAGTRASGGAVLLSGCWFLWAWRRGLSKRCWPAWCWHLETGWDLNVALQVLEKLPVGFCCCHKKEMLTGLENKKQKKQKTTTKRNGKQTGESKSVLSCPPPYSCPLLSFLAEGKKGYMEGWAWSWEIAP